jgi:hypothetical protein
MLLKLPLKQQNDQNLLRQQEQKEKLLEKENNTPSTVLCRVFGVPVYGYAKTPGQAC